MTIEGVASVSEQGHDAQAAHLLFVVETVAAVLLANRVQQALLFPEMQGRDTHAHLPGRFSHPDPLGMMGALQRSRTVQPVYVGRRASAPPGGVCQQAQHGARRSSQAPLKGRPGEALA